MPHLNDDFLLRVKANRCSPEEMREAWAHARECRDCAERLEAVEPQTQPVAGLAPPPPPTSPGSAGLGMGAMLGRYLILEPLGEGGMGVVYAAYDPKLDRKVALKLLRPQEPTSARAAEARARLLREAQAMARVTHPNVVAVHDAGAHEDQVFIAMELVDGVTLSRWLQQEPRSWRQVLEVLMEAGRGLAAAHSAGLVHRDFKPANVLISRDGRARVTDFGLARLTDGVEAEPTPRTVPTINPAPLLGSTLTAAGQVLGTPFYMAPELFRGQPPDARADQFSFCVSLYEALYGRRPFDPRVFLDPVQSRPDLPPPPRGSKVPAWLYRVVARGLSLEPESRFPSLEALLQALSQGRERSRRGRMATAALLVLLPTLVAATLYTRTQHQACARQGEALAGVWQDSARQRLRHAFLSTQSPHAAATADRASSALDAYARDWGQLRTEVCEAGRSQGTTPTGALVLQAECLEQRRSQFQMLVEVLTRDPDEKLVSKAISAVQGLSPISDCADLKALTSAPPPPVDPAAREQLATLQSQVDRLRALYLAGKYTEGLAQAERTLPAVEALGYLPLEGRALLTIARLRAETPDLEGAVAASRRAISAFAQSGATVQEGVAWGVLYHLICNRQARPKDAMALQIAVEAALDRMGQARERIEVLQGFAACLFSAGEHAASVPLLERTLETANRMLGPDNLGRFFAMRNLALAYGAVGRFKEADKVFQETLAFQQRVLGPEHPEVALSLITIGGFLHQTGRFKEARDQLQQARMLAQRVYGPESPRTTFAEVVLAANLRLLSQSREAEVLARHALVANERAAGPMAITTAEAHLELGDALVSLGRYPEGEHHIRQAHSIYEHHGMSPTYALQSLGALRLIQGQPAQARAAYERALVLLVKEVPEDHPDLALLRAALARTLLRLGQGEQARQLSELAVGAVETKMGADSPFMGLPLLARGELQAARREWPQALTTLERALAVAPASLTPEARLALAEALLRSGKDRARALSLVREARDFYRDLGNAARQAELQRWLGRQG